MNGLKSSLDINSDLLNYLSNNEGAFSSIELASQLNIDHQKIVGAIKSISSIDSQIINFELKLDTEIRLTDHGLETINEGTLEARVFSLLKCQPKITRGLIENAFPNAIIGLNRAISLGWVKVEKCDDSTCFITNIDKIEDTTVGILRNIESSKACPDDSILRELIKGKLVTKNKLSYYLLTRGPDFRTCVSKQQTDLTTDMIADDSWKTANLKPFNFASLGIPPRVGCLHPLMKVKSAIRQIFFEMGFQEMMTDNYVESSFWNFDALFQPQKHPARDMHDTFFLSSPSESRVSEKDYCERVREMHMTGGSGSSGYQSEWHHREARKNILRTHTTATTAKMLYKLSQKEFKPMKYFSIDRVFRNEAVDATHLAEFHQIEGSVIDYDLSLSDLMGLVTVFFNKLGITDLRFKAAYNPYTEPSMEIFHYHKQLNKLVEIGNSGLIRREVLAPMGFPHNVNCIAWGISLERPTMILYEMTNIRDLVGHRVGIDNIRNTPICTFHDLTHL